MSRRWQLSARGFGHRQLEPILQVEGETLEEAFEAVRASRYHHVLALSTQHVRLDPIDPAGPCGPTSRV